MNKPRLQAEPEYENAHLAADELLDRIRELIFDQPAPGSDVPINWEHVGTMTEVNQRLTSVVNFLLGTEQ